MGETIRRMTRPSAGSAHRPGGSRKARQPFAFGVAWSLALFVLVLAAAGTVFGAKPAPVPPQSFEVSGLAANAAGTVQTIKVTALISGKVNPGYRGSVELTSTDGQAVLPVRYTFTAADKGARSFSVQLKTAGSQTVTATDAANSLIKGAQTVTVTPAAAATYALSSLSAVTAGTSQSLTLTVRDVYGNLATNYRGTVRAISSDAQAGLPANHGFTAGDAGSHTFSVTLKTVGQQTVTFSDTATATLTASAGPVGVTPASAASLTLHGLAAGVAGDAQSVSVTAHDAFGNLATGYRGTVAFSSNDAQASLPANHAFTASDAGARQFDVTLKTAGSNTSITVTDTATSTLTSSQAVAIGNGPAADIELTTDVTASFEGQPVVTAGQPFPLTVRVVDAYGNTAVDYVGTIAIGSTELVFGLPLAINYDFTAANGGSRTFPNFVLTEKRIYNEHATISASDGSKLAAMDLQVMPGPAVSYSACRPAYSQSSSYQQVNAPIGVNDAIGFYFDALDAYGNVATNRQPANPFVPALPTGYEASASVVTSDLQADFFSRGAIALFSGSRNVVGPQIEVRLRTAGHQDITITDPINPALTTTCTYGVKGPKAFNGTFDFADPKSTGNTIYRLPLSSYLPPNDSGYTIENLVGPSIGFVPIGTVEADVATGLPMVIWDLDPDDAPGTILRCDTQSACTLGPIVFSYRVRDTWGNASDGTFTVRPWNASIGGGNIIYSGDGTIGPVTGTLVPLGASLDGVVIGTRPGEASVRIGTSVVTVAMPADGTLTVGMDVSVKLSRPLVVGGTTPDCVPDVGKTCEVASFVEVTLLNVPTAEVPEAPVLVGLQTLGLDMCGFWSEDMTGCPAVTFHIAPLPGTTPPEGVEPGSGFPPVGHIDFQYHFQFRGNSTIAESIEFTLVNGTHLPAGLTLDPNGLISGTPTTAELVSFEVQARGTVSGATASEIFTILVSAQTPN